MKRLVSIPLIFLILFSGVSVKIASHYCGGYVAATKVSLSGELATCGMEKPENDNSYQETFSKHCCDDVTASFSISNIYLASFFSIDDTEQHIIDLEFSPTDLSSNNEPAINIYSNNIKPPGAISLISTDQPVLCIFRI